MASVLIVDDDRALRKLMRAYLEQESISVIEAESGMGRAARVTDRYKNGTGGMIR